MNTRSKTAIQPFRVRQATFWALTSLLVPAALVAQIFPSVGLSAVRSRLLLDPADDPLGADNLSYFGRSLAVGDFNADGVDDLAVGVPGNRCFVDGHTFLDCGAAAAFLGSRGGGLAGSPSMFDLSTPGSVFTPRTHDRYGEAVASGDFNGDGFDDLAVGAPSALEDSARGRVFLHYGVAGGIFPNPSRLLEPGGALPVDAGYRLLGQELAAGDFDGDGLDDLIIADPASDGSAGTVTLVYGGGWTVFPLDGFRIAQDEEGIPDDAESEDEFGAAVAVGDFNGDGFDDLAIGVPGEDDCGAFLTLFGSPNSLIFANHYWLGEVDLGGACESGDRLGDALAAGDLNGDGFDDLVYGVPSEDGNDGETDMGMLGILPGAPGSPATGGGFNLAARQWWWESLIPGFLSEVGDNFGRALAVGDFDGDGFDDVAVGVPWENSTTADFGKVAVLRGGLSLLTGAARPFVAAAEGLPALPEPPIPQTQLLFGSVLAAGDFDGDHSSDLAVGIPYLHTAVLSGGGVVALHGALFADGFERSDADYWSNLHP